MAPVRHIAISNQAGDLAKVFPLLQRAARGIIGLRMGKYRVEEPIAGTFRVVNTFTGRDYAVQFYQKPGVWTCDCPDFRHRQTPICKHIVAVWESGLVNGNGVPQSCEPPF